MAYVSEPKDLALYEKDDKEETESIVSTDTDEPVEPREKREKGEKRENKEGFTGSVSPDKTSPNEAINQTKSTGMIYSFFAPPDVSGQTIQERMVAGVSLFIYRIFVLVILVMFGINFRFAANKFANEDYFPTDGTRPPYYPTPEELKQYEAETMDLRKLCKNDADAEFIGRFRRPDQTYPEFLFYGGMKLPNKDPCITEGAMTDGWYVRLSLQVSTVFNYLVNSFTSLFSRALKGTTDLVESAVIEPEMKIAEEGEQLATKFVKDYETAIEGSKAKAFTQEEQAKTNAYIKREQADVDAQKKLPPAQRRVANTNRAPVQSVQRGQGKANSFQMGGDKSSDASSSSSAPKHVYGKQFNPYAFDRERKLADLTYFYRPIWAKSAFVAGSYTNMALSLLLSIFKGNTEIKESHGTFNQLLNICLFILSGVVLILMFAGMPVYAFIAWCMGVISILLGGGGVPAISVPLLSITGFGIPVAIYILVFLAFNQVVNTGIVLWRILYMFGHILAGPFIVHKKGKGELQEYMAIIRKDLNGFFALAWLVFVFSAYQVSPPGYDNGILGGGILAPILFGFAMKSSSSSNVGDMLSVMSTS